MKRIITLFGAFALLTNLNSFSYAQALEDFKPSSVNQLGKAYPQVNSEGRVRAQLYAPEAKKVQLDITAKCIEGTHIAYEINYKFTVNTRSYSTKFNPLNPKPKARRSDALLYLRSLIKTLDDNPTLKRKYQMELRPQKRLNYNYR